MPHICCACRGSRALGQSKRKQARGIVHRWIGNAAEDGRAATVFARLKVPSLDGLGNIVDHGVHAIIVPLRDASGQCLPGVEIRDCGYKVTLTWSHHRPFCPLATSKGKGAASTLQPA